MKSPFSLFQLEEQGNYESMLFQEPESTPFFEGIVSSTVIRLWCTKVSWKIPDLYSRPNTAVGDRLTFAVAKPFTLRQPIKNLA